MVSMENGYEDMEFEYTNPEPFMITHYYNNDKKPAGLFSLPPSGTFSVPSSFFEDHYKKSNVITNAVCSLLDKFTLNEEPSTNDTNDESNAEVIYSIFSCC